VKTATLVAAFVCLALAAAVGGQPSSSDKKPSGPSVDQLIEQLGDPDFRKRDKAGDLLKVEGVKALPALREALKNPDPEIRRRLVDLIPAIESDAILAPKRVTLSMKDKPLNEIFAELTKQTGYHYEFQHNQPNSKFTLDLKNATYWEAVDEIGKSTGMDLQQGYGDDHVRFYYRGDNTPASSYSSTDGGFRFTAISFQSYKSVDLTQRGRGVNTRSESLTFMFAVQSEPKLPILGLSEPHLTAAFDNEKNSMLIASDPNEAMEWEGRGKWGRGGRLISRYGNGQRMWYMQTQVNLNRGSEKATAVKELRGTIPVTLLAEQKPHVVAENVLKAKGTKAVIGTTMLHIEEATAVPNSNNIQVKVTFNEDTGGNQNDYSWQNAIWQRLEVQDAKGNKYQVYGQNWGNSGPNSMQITFTYGPMDQTKKPEGDVKLIFHEWKLMQHQLKFEFKDLPLP
jgi:hypothetical protein